MRRFAPIIILAAACAAQPAHAEAGDFLLRGRAIMVAPNEDSGTIQPAFPNERVSISNSIMPEVDVTYMVTDNIGVELIAATTRHDANGVTGTTGAIGELASAWALPPTLTVQYHFAPRGHVRPYAGVGVNYTIFWNEEASDALEAAVGPTRVSFSDSAGWAVQAGVDIDISERLFLNLDVKYIDMDTNARLRTTAAGTQSVRVSLDPFVFGIGIGTRF